VRGREGRHLLRSRNGIDDLVPQINDNYLCTDNLEAKLSIDTFVDCNHLSAAIPSDREDICAEHKCVRQICPDTCAGLCISLD